MFSDEFRTLICNLERSNNMLEIAKVCDQFPSRDYLEQSLNYYKTEMEWRTKL